MITDSQIHVWEVDRPDRPWPTDVRAAPQKPNGFSAEDALAAMDASGVDRAVIVPPSWAGDDNANLTAFEAVDRHTGRFRVMARFDPTLPDAETRLETLLSDPHVLGIRMSMAMLPFSNWIKDGTLDFFWRVCEERGKPVMVLVPSLLRQTERVAKKHPRLQLLIDHMGCDLSQRGAKAFPWFDQLVEIAKQPNVAIKVSSAPNFSNDDYPFADIERFMRGIYDAFGAERMLWGSDLTRLRSTYDECQRHFREGLRFLTQDDKDWILGKSTATLLKWPEA